MENMDARQELSAAERAAAAPYVEIKADPWWVAPGFGLLGLLLVLSRGLRAQADAPDWASTLPLALIVLGSLGYVLWQRRRLGALPAGPAPREINRVLRWFVVGAALVAIALFVLGDRAPLWLGLPLGFALATGGMAWYGAAYGRAASRVRERLA